MKWKNIGRIVDSSYRNRLRYDESCTRLVLSRRVLQQNCTKTATSDTRVDYKFTCVRKDSVSTQLNFIQFNVSFRKGLRL